MQVLIAGITGFVGSHLAEYALKMEAEVFGSIRWRSKTENIEHLRSRITLIESDLRDLSSVQGLLDVANPDYVVHLAPRASWRLLADAGRDALHQHVSQVNLPEAIWWRPKKARFWWRASTGKPLNTFGMRPRAT